MAVLWAESGGRRARSSPRCWPGTVRETLVVVLPHARDIDDFHDDLRLFTDATVEQFPAWESDAGERVLHDEIFGDTPRLLKELTPVPATPRAPASRRLAAADDYRHRDPKPPPACAEPGRPAGRNSERSASATARRRRVHSLARRAAARARRRSSCPASSRSAAAFSTSSRPTRSNPLRIELFGDEVESIRTFDVATQRSLESHDSADVTVLAAKKANRTHFASYLPPGSWFMLVEPAGLDEEGRHFHRRLERPEDFFATSTTLAEMYKFPSVTASGVPAGSYETTAHLQFESVEQFSGDVARVRGELDAAATGQQVYLVCETDAEVERLAEVFGETQLAAEGRLHFVQGRLGAAAFGLVHQQVVLVSAPRAVPPPRAVAALAARSRAGRSTASCSSAKATWSSTSPTASAATAASKLMEKEGARRGAPGARVCRGHADLRAHEQDRAGAEVRRRAQGASRRWPRSAAQLAAAEEGGRAGGRRSGDRDAPAAGGPRGAARHRVSARHASGSGSSTRRFPTRKRPISSPPSTRSRPTCSSRGRWIACCAATSASARPSWRFAPRSRRSTPATRSPCSCRRRSWPSSTCARSRSGWPSFPFEIAALSRFCTAKETAQDPRRRRRGHDRPRSSARIGSRRPTCSSRTWGW